MSGVWWRLLSALWESTGESDSERFRNAYLGPSYAPLVRRMPMTESTIERRARQLPTHEARGFFAFRGTSKRSLRGLHSAEIRAVRWSLADNVNFTSKQLKNPIIWEPGERPYAFSTFLCPCVDALSALSAPNWRVCQVTIQMPILNGQSAQCTEYSMSTAPTDCPECSCWLLAWWTGKPDARPA